MWWGAQDNERRNHDLWKSAGRKHRCREAFFPFHYGRESESYAFYRIPKILFRSDVFKQLSIDAKLLYGMLLDRMELSSRNGWIDEEGKVYIYFTRQSVMEIMDCGSKKAGQLLAELDGKTGIGLITRVRQGLGKPDRIYVRKCITPRMPVRGSPQAESALPDVSNDHIRRCQKDTSAGVENAGLEESKGSPNHTEKNNMRTMKFEPVTAHIPMKMYSIIHSPECFYRFVEDFEIDGVCWDTVAVTMSPYFLRLLETGNSARPRSSDHSFNYKTEKLPRSLSEYLYCLFDHSCMWRQKSGNLICTAQPYGTRKMVMDSFSRMMEECDYPETIKMEMLDNRYRFRTNGDFLLLFYSSSSPRLILPESIAPPGTYSSLRWGVDSNVWTE